MKPYYQAVRIGRDETTKAEYTYRIVLLWETVVRIEEANPGDDDRFVNDEAKTVVFTTHGSYWILGSFDGVQAAWLAWLDAQDAPAIFSLSKN